MTKSTMIKTASSFNLSRGHEKGWNYLLGVFLEQFGNGSHKKYCWEDAHPEEAVKNELSQESHTE
jgi:hypothetical protein